MASESPPATYSPTAKGDAEVLSQRTFPGQGESQEAIMVAPEGETSAAGHTGGKSPWRLAMGGMFSLAPIQIRFRRPIRLQNPVCNLLRKKGVCPFCR